MSEEDLKWLKKSLHGKDCRQCNLVRVLIRALRAELEGRTSTPCGHKFCLTNVNGCALADKAPR